ncbi:MAG TPA: gliding motility-associated protein GldE, partial [Algoriphagus sp.]|nr:gliding motility-associated protein GldE [Algoriphagus sp.]
MDDPYPSWYLLTQITQPSVGYLLFNGLLFILLLLGSALVSGSEVAFFSFSNEDLESI